MYLSPGASFGMAKAKEYGSSSGVPAQDGRGEDQQLVGDRADGGQQSGAADDDPVVVLADDVRPQRAVDLLARRPRGWPAAGSACASEQVLLTDLPRSSAGCSYRRRGRPGRTSLAGPTPSARVEVIAGTAENAERVIGPELGGLRVSWPGLSGILGVRKDVATGLPAVGEG